MFDDLYRTDLKYLIPLIGVFIGWLLTTFSSISKNRGENKKLLSKSIVQLYFINHKMLVFQSYSEHMKDRVGLGERFEYLRQYGLKRYALSEDNIKAAQEAIENVSQLYPLLGIKLKSIIEGYLFHSSVKLTNSVKTKELYIKLLSANEAISELDQKHFKKIIMRLAFKHNVLTWLKFYSHYRDLKKRDIKKAATLIDPDDNSIFEEMNKGLDDFSKNE